MLKSNYDPELGVTVTVRRCDGTSGLASVLCTSEVFYPGYIHERNQRIGGICYEKNSKTEFANTRSAEWAAVYASLDYWIFWIYSVSDCSSLYYSFCDYSVIKEPVFTGVKNYVTLFHDQVFLKRFKNTAYMMLIGVPMTTFFAVAVSVMLNNKKLRHTGWMRVVFFLPTLVPTVVACLLWIWVMQPETGVVNTLLGYIGIKGPGWLASPTWAKPAFIMMMIWTCGNAIIIYLAGLQDISETLYEAAEIDGASFFRETISITLPLLKPTILYNMVTLVIGVFQWFAEPYIMTQGGPNNATMFYSLYLYQNAFTYFKMGYASAQAWIMLIFALLIILLLFKGFKFGQTDE